jgi:hypothetical protein
MILPRALILAPIVLMQAPMTTQPIWQRANEALLITDVEDLRKIQGELVATHLPDDKDKWRQYLLAYTNAKIIQLLPQSGRKAILEDTLQLLEKLDSPEAVALRANLYPFKIPQNPIIYGPVLGMKSGSQMDKAEKAAPNNPRVLYFKATSLFYKPSMFGGSHDKGLAMMLRALELFEKETPSQEPWALTWGKTEAHVKLAEFYFKMGNLPESKLQLEIVKKQAPAYAAQLEAKLSVQAGEKK